MQGGKNMAAYWDNICRMQQKQTAKGIETYGQPKPQVLLAVY